jgi:hypothetical protein
MMHSKKEVRIKFFLIDVFPGQTGSYSSNSNQDIGLPSSPRTTTSIETVLNFIMCFPI